MVLHQVSKLFLEEFFLRESLVYGWCKRFGTACGTNCSGATRLRYRLKVMYITYATTIQKAQDFQFFVYDLPR